MPPPKNFENLNCSEVHSGAFWMFKFGKSYDSISQKKDEIFNKNAVVCYFLLIFVSRSSNSDEDRLKVCSLLTKRRLGTTLSKYGT